MTSHTTTELEFDVTRKTWTVGGGYQDAAVVLTPTEHDRGDDENEAMDILRTVLGESGKGGPYGTKYITAHDSMSEGETHTLDEVIELVSEEFEAEQKARKQAADEKTRKEAEKEARRESLDMTVKRRWEEGSGEIHAIKASVRLEDPETGESGEFVVRNAVDIGYQVFPDDDVADDFADRGRDYLQEFAPIHSGFRMTENDGRF